MSAPTKKAAPKKRPAARRSPASAPVVAPRVGEPVGRWARILAEGQDTPGLQIEPFEVTDGLVLQPLTPRRAAKLGAAQTSYLAALAASANAVQFGATRDQVDEINTAIADSLQAYNEALFGEDVFPAASEYFADKPAWQQELFVEAVKKQFLRLPDEDGKCPACSHTPGGLEARIAELEAALVEVDPSHPLVVQGGGQVGKEGGSSTTSSTTGTKSKKTSSTSATESTPGTGSAEPDPGLSS